MGGCIIYLDNFNNYYSAGGTIRGRVVCTFNSYKKFRGIGVKVRGKEHTSWTRSESYYDSTTERTETRTVVYTGDNTFLANQFLVSGPAKVNAGIYEYPFDFVLPVRLPDTFKNTHGHIEYYIKAYVDIQWGLDYGTRQDIVVKTPIDLNRIVRLPLNPVCYEDVNNVCCCCCVSGPITMQLHLDRDVFAITERPKLRVHILNMSNQSTDCLRVELAMTMSSKVTSPSSETKTNKELIATAYDSGVGAHGDRTYDIALDIPRTTFVPNLNLSRLFEQRVMLKVIAVVSGCHQNSEIKVPILLGHIPLANTGHRAGTYQRNDRSPPLLTGDPPPNYGSYGRSNSSGPCQFDVRSMVHHPNMTTGPSAPPAYDTEPSAPVKDEIADVTFASPGNNSGGPSPPPYHEAIKSERTAK